MNYNNFNVEKSKDLMACANSKTLKILAERFFAKVAKELNCQIDLDKVNLEFNAYSYGFKLSSHVSSHTEEHYDALLSQPETYPSGTKFYCTKEENYTFITPREIPVKIFVTCSSDISKDDMETLRNLGKVHREVVPARGYDSVVCAI